MAKNSLSEYSAKRTFAATPEPPPAVPRPEAGRCSSSSSSTRARRLHYDFRLECDGVLKSWAVPKGPSLDPSEKRLAVQTEDHPYDYASFEGVIPPGQYGAGEVIVWDCGVYSPDEGGATWFHDRAEAEREVREGLDKGKLSFLLRGEKLKGSFALVRTKEEEPVAPHQAQGPLRRPTRRHRRRTARCSPASRSRSSRSLPVQRMPGRAARARGQDRGDARIKLAPMLAEPGDAPFNRPDWMWEPKLDGYRVLAFIDEQRREAALAARPRARAAVSRGSPRELAQAGGGAA